MVEISDEHRRSVASHLHPAHTLFHPQKKYIFVGGNAGLGLALALWALDRGATYIVLASSSGTLRGREQLLVNEAMRKHPAATICVVQ